jgi:Ca2+-binding RTX toxin-like protein
MKNLSLNYDGRLLLFLLALAATGTTILGSNSSPVWADVIEGTEGPDAIVGTPVDDLIDSKGGDDINDGDTFIGNGFGHDVILSGEGNDFNSGDTELGDGSGNDVILSGEGDDQSTGNGGRDIFVCGDGEDTITDYNAAEGDIATPDCENI